MINAVKELTAGTETLDPTLGTVTFSGLAGELSSGQRPGYNSVTRVLPEDRVR